MICHGDGRARCSLWQLRHEDQETVSRSLLEHCELDWEDNCLNFQNNKGVVLTSSRGQVKSEIFRSSLNKWEKYIDYLQPLQKLVE